MSDTLFSLAIRLLARRAHSCAELRRKLSRKGAAKEDIEEVVDRLKSLGYLNDQEFAELRARALRRGRFWGDRRIELDLKNLGVDARIIRVTLRDLESEFPESDALRRICQAGIKASGTPKTASDLKKLYDRCLRLGHSPEHVRSELDPYFSRIEW